MGPALKTLFIMLASHSEVLVLASTILPMIQLLASFLPMNLGRHRKMVHMFGPATQVEHQLGVLSSWLPSALTMAVAAVWEVNQQRKDVSLHICQFAFQIHKPI